MIVDRGFLGHDRCSLNAATSYCVPGRCQEIAKFQVIAPTILVAVPEPFMLDLSGDANLAYRSATELRMSAVLAQNNKGLSDERSFCAQATTALYD